MIGLIGVFARTRLLGFALLALTFLAGALSGAAIDRVLGAEEVDRDVPREAREGERDRSYVIDRVEMEPDRRATIDSILDRRTERMRAIWSEVRPRMDAITDSARAEIMSALSPDQRARYEQLLEERRKDRRSHRDRDGD